MARRFPTDPLVGVGAVIIDGDRVVMCRRGNPPRKGGWSLPGGGQELGETVAETAVREAYEETGLRIEVLGIVDVIDSIMTDDNGEIEYHYTLIDVAAQVVGGALEAGDDADEVGWFSIDGIRDLDTWKTTVEVIEKALKTYSSSGGK